MLKEFANRRPFTLAMLTVLPIPAFVGLMTWLFPAVPAEVTGMGAQAVGTVIAAICLTALGWWRAAGFNSPKEWRSLWVYIVPLLLLVAAATAPVHVKQPAQLVTFALMAIWIGISEEIGIRGLFIPLLQRYGPMGTMLISAVTFALLHATNLFMGADPTYTAVQVVSNIFSGIALAAVRIRSNTVWLLILFHALNDFTMFITRDEALVVHTPTTAQLVTKIGVNAVLCLYGLWITKDAWWPGLKRTTTAA